MDNLRIQGGVRLGNIVPCVLLSRTVGMAQVAVVEHADIYLNIPGPRSARKFTGSTIRDGDTISGGKILFLLC